MIFRNYLLGPYIRLALNGFQQEWTKALLSAISDHETKHMKDPEYQGKFNRYTRWTNESQKTED